VIEYLREAYFNHNGEQPNNRAILKGSRAVCACYGVREAEIRAAVAAGADLARLQKELRCGTSCGSCLPELKRLAA